MWEEEIEGERERGGGESEEGEREGGGGRSDLTVLSSSYTPAMGSTYPVMAPCPRKAKLFFNIPPKTLHA